MLRKLMISLIVLLLFIGGAAAGLAYYVRPSQELTLNYSKVTLADKIADMVKRRQATLVVGEEDVNNLLKMKLASEPPVDSDFKLTGADFRLQDGVLLATMKLLWKDRLPIEAVARYRLTWTGSELHAEPQGVSVKGFKLPASMAKLPAPRISLNEYVPAPVGVKNVRFQGTELVVELGLR